MKTEKLQLSSTNIGLNDPAFLNSSIEIGTLHSIGVNKFTTQEILSKWCTASKSADRILVYGSKRQVHLNQRVEAFGKHFPFTKMQLEYNWFQTYPQSRWIDTPDIPS